MAEMVGGLFAELIVTSKVRVTRLFEEPPSSTVTKIVAVPVTFEAERKLSVPVGLEAL